MSPLKAFPLGLQHFLSMFGATVLVPMLMGFSPSISVMSSGIGTALYLLVTKGKIPSYLGPSFSFIGPIVMASAAAGAAGIGSAIVCAGLIFIACALLIRRIGTAWIDRLIPPIVMASIILVIGCGLSATAVKEAFLTDGAVSSWPALVVAFVSLGTVIACTCFGKKVLCTIPVLAGAVVAYALSCCFGMVDFSAVEQAAWLGLPDISLPSFNWQAIVLVSPIALVVVIEHIGHLFVIGEMTGHNYNTMAIGAWRWACNNGGGVSRGASGNDICREYWRHERDARVFDAGVLVCGGGGVSCRWFLPENWGARWHYSRSRHWWHLDRHIRAYCVQCV